MSYYLYVYNKPDGGNPMKIRLCGFFLLLGVAFSICVIGCDSRSGRKNTGNLTDIPLQSYQYGLLDLAFSTASAIPVNPHIKDRSLAQESVVTACLQLDQPIRALGYVRQIDNWRRGAGYADIAFYCVRHGATQEQVEPYLDQAAQAAAETEDWRRDRINVKIAKSRAYLGQIQQADQLAADVVPAETGKVAGVKAIVGDEETFDEQMESLNKLISIGNFDILRNTLESCVLLFDRFYTDQRRRSRVEERIKTAWNPLPIAVRIDLLMEMTDSALDHLDQAKALALVNEAREFLDNHEWPPEYRFPMAAKLIALRFRAGDEKHAEADADELLSNFETEGKKIVNIYRAEALRPLAEAYQVMRKTAAALEVYKQVIEAGVENPNSRPRAEDLTATCCSMAVYAVEPDAELFDRIREIYDGLGDPW